MSVVAAVAVADALLPLLPPPPSPPHLPPPMITVEVVPHGSGFIGCQMTTVDVEPTIDKPQLRM